MKPVFIILLLFAIGDSCLAQQDSLADIFPLQIGNNWMYNFSVDYIASVAEYEEKDVGVATYQIVSSLLSVDSTRWEFVRKRSFTRTTYSFGIAQSPIPMHDSISFEIVEMNKGRHELYVPEPPDFQRTSVFPFWRLYGDSTRIYRYVSIDSTGTFKINKYVAGLIEIQRNVIFRKKVGVIQSIGDKVVVNSDAGIWSYNLISPLYSGPHITFNRSVTFSALAGISTDTTVVLKSDGTDTVHIYSITSSDPDLQVSFASSMILPVSDVALYLRHTSPKNGISSARVIITSSSITSPDSIDITIQGRVAAVLKTNKEINFGQVFFSKRFVDTTLSIVNTGNTILRIDTIISSQAYGYPIFVSSVLTNKKLNPGDTALCKVRMSLTSRNNTDESYLSFYSNAASSPDKISLIATIKGGWITFDVKSLSFGFVDIGVTKSLEFGINPIWGNAYLQRIKTSNPVFITPNIVPPILNATFGEIVQFAPRIGGVCNGYILYSSRSIDPNDTIPAIDTVWLSGNGVPVNTLSTSIIDFGNKIIGEHCDTTLTISNIKDVPQEILREIPNPDPSIQITTQPLGSIEPFLSIKDTIRFVPISKGNHSCVIYYHFLNAGVQTSIDSVHIYGLGIFIPTLYSLNQNYPNPFNLSTIISFDVPFAGFVSVKVYNMLGREVAILVNEEMMQGSFERTFIGNKLASGIYFYRMHAGNFTQTRKLLLLK